jgi:hypothetical protein
MHKGGAARWKIAGAQGNIDNIQERNARILPAIDDSPSGEIKSASASGTNMIRRRIREYSCEGLFLRRQSPTTT